MFVFALETVLTWILTVWIPSLLMIAVIRYFAIKHNDLWLRTLSWALTVAVTLLLAVKGIKILSETGALEQLSNQSRYAAIGIGWLVGVLSLALTRRLAERLTKLNV
ncbi:hypothetical protein LCM19_05260 [Qipengyuania flava]|nr:hypothetical protein [Qipengyuania flava]